MLRLKGLAALTGLLLASAAHAAMPSFEGNWIVAAPGGALTPVDKQPIPFTAEGRKKLGQNKALAAKKDYSFDTTVSRCSSPGMPRMMLTSQPLRILQRPEMMVFLFKWNHIQRQIDLRANPPHVPKPGDADFLIPTPKGNATGRWEGDTLVAHTTGISPDNLMDNKLLPNSDQLELTERFRLIDDNTLQDRITITDPGMYSRPWDAVVSYKRLPESAFPFGEDTCLDRKEAGQATWPG